MTLNRRVSGRSTLCVIVDRETLGPRSLVRVARAAARAGADMVQYRDKVSTVAQMIRTARAIGRAIARYRSSFIVNDRLEVAVAAGADGLHVGQGDLDCRTARRILGPGKIVGVSVRTEAEARCALSDGADYVGVGPVFRTPIKGSEPALGIGICSRLVALGIPAMAIGGITEERAETLVTAGCRRIAVIRAVAGASDPYAAAERFRRILERR